MLYQISYELKAENKDYTPLYAAIKRFGEWQHPLETVWYVITDAPMSELYYNLMGTIEQKTDKLIISSITVINSGGRASSEFWEWIKKSMNYDNKS